MKGNNQERLIELSSLLKIILEPVYNLAFIANVLIFVTKNVVSEEEYRDILTRSIHFSVENEDILAEIGDCKQVLRGGYNTISE